MRTGRWGVTRQADRARGDHERSFRSPSVKESPVQQLVVHPVSPGDTTCAHVDILFVTNHHRAPRTSTRSPTSPTTAWPIRGGLLPRPSPRQGSGSVPARGSVRASSPAECCWTWRSTGRCPRVTRCRVRTWTAPRNVKAFTSSPATPLSCEWTGSSVRTRRCRSRASASTPFAGCTAGGFAVRGGCGGRVSGA